MVTYLYFITILSTLGMDKEEDSDSPWDSEVLIHFETSILIVFF